MKKTIAFAIVTCSRSRIRAAKHRTAVSCIVGKFLRKMAESAGTPFSPKITVKL